VFNGLTIIELSTANPISTACTHAYSIAVSLLAPVTWSVAIDQWTDDRLVSGQWSVSGHTHTHLSPADGFNHISTDTLTQSLTRPSLRAYCDLPHTPTTSRMDGQTDGWSLDGGQSRVKRVEVTDSSWYSVLSLL